MTEEHRRIRTSWTVVGVLTLAAAVNYADRAAFSAVLPPLRKELGLSDAELGLVGSVFLWAYACASPLAGTLADRWSRARLVGWSLALWSAATLLTGWAQGLALLIACRVLLGLFESLYHPAAFALVADHHGSATRARAMSLLSVGFQCGVIGGGAAAGYLAEQFGWRMGFWVLGGAGIALSLIAPRYVSDGPLRAAGRAVRPRLTEALGYLFRVPSFHFLLAKSMLTGITTWIFFAWLPLYYQETFHLSLGAAGLAGTAILQITKVAGIGLGGWVSDHFAAKDRGRRILVLAGCYACAAPFLLIFLASPSLGLVSVAVATFSLFGGMGLANEQPTLSEVVPVRFRSTAIGISNTFATAAGGLGVLLAGVLKQDIGLQGVFAGSFVIYLVTAALLAFCYARYVRADIARAGDAG